MHGSAFHGDHVGGVAQPSGSESLNAHTAKQPGQRCLHTYRRSRCEQHAQLDRRSVGATRSYAILGPPIFPLPAAP